MSGAGQALQRTWDVLVKGETPQAPSVAPPPPPPSLNNQASAKAADSAAAEERKKARGRSATYLTGAAGVTAQATTAGRTLLGA